MPKYFFNVRDGASFISDPDGSRLPNLEAVYSEATMNAREIVADNIRSGQIVGEKLFEITDEGGVVIATFPLRNVFL